MMIEVQLFESEKIRLAPIDHEKDAEVESIWTFDAEYLRLLSLEPARALCPAQIKKKYEKIEKEAEESKSLFYFTIRTRPEDRLIGFARLYGVEWANGVASIQLGIGDHQDHRRGYGLDVLRLLLRYAFAELNLYRLAAIIPAYNQPALGLFEKAGFVEEVRRRQAVNRDGQRWDLIHLGILRPEWAERNG